jgi:hypothetical protein
MSMAYFYLHFCILDVAILIQVSSSGPVWFLLQAWISYVTHLTLKGRRQWAPQVEGWEKAVVDMGGQGRGWNLAETAM